MAAAVQRELARVEFVLKQTPELLGRHLITLSVVADDAVQPFRPDLFEEPADLFLRLGGLRCRERRDAVRQLVEVRARQRGDG